MVARPPALLKAFGFGRTPELRESFTRRALREQPQKPGLRDRFLVFNWYVFFRTSFLLMVVAPSLLALAYVMFVASPTYTVETRFAVRAATDRPLVEGYIGGDLSDMQPSAGAVGDKGGATRARQKAGVARQAAESNPSGGAGLSLRSRAGQIASAALNALGAGAQAGPEPYIVANYLYSQDLVNALDADGWLRARFAGGDPDWLHALPSDASAERLRRYWRSMVIAGNDVNTNLITVHVSAYTPEDAFEIAKRVVAQSEALINRMTERSRRDKQRLADQDVIHAEQRYLKSEAAMRELRTTEGVIDPMQQGEQIYKQVMQLLTARISLEVQIRLSEPHLSPDAPQLKSMRQRLAAIDTELQKAKARLSGTPEAATNFIARFEGLETERVVAATLYGLALDGQERTRLEAERQATYLAVFAPPYLPQSASMAGMNGMVLAIFMLSLVIWSIFMLLTAAGRDTLG